MPALPELEVVQEVLNRRLPGQTIVSAEVIPPGRPIVVRDLTGEGFGPALAGARFDSVVRRGKFLVVTLTPTHHDPRSAAERDPHTHTPLYLVINPMLTRRSTARGHWADEDEAGTSQLTVLSRHLSMTCRARPVRKPRSAVVGASDAASW